MKIYKISQSENCGYETYSAAIVAANSPEEAIRIHPDSGDEDSSWLWDEKTGWMFRFRGENEWRYSSSEWAPISQIKVEYIGEAAADVKPGVILASYCSEKNDSSITFVEIINRPFYNA